MDLRTIGVYILPILLIILFAIVTYKVLKKVLVNLEKRQTPNEDKTKFNFLKNSVGVVVYSIAAIFIINTIPQLKSLGTALFAGAGIIAAIVGFASQAAFSNIISGIFIVIFKPFRVGDIIEINNNQKGIIENITFRHTVIRNYENRRIIIPNSIISNETIINSSIEEEAIRKHLHFSISYESNIDVAFTIIREEIEKHPLLVDKRTEEDKIAGISPIDIKVIAWGESSIDLKAFVWTANNDASFTLQCDVLKSVKERFEQTNIEIPYPHRVIINKNSTNDA